MGFRPNGRGHAEGDRYRRLSEKPCPCGKRYTFPNIAKAKEYLAEIHKWYSGDPNLIPRRIYSCEVSPGHFHVTSKPMSNRYNRLKLLERELHRDMATLRMNIIKVMEEIYAGDNTQYKFSSGPLAELMVKKYPTYAKTSIQAEFSKMRKDGVIVNLGEKVPDAPGGAMYFCLAEHLDKITTPEAKKEEPKLSVPAIKHTSPPAVKPSAVKAAPAVTPPSNPMDKVLSQLGEILSKVNGLTNGYTQMVEYQKVQREAIQGMWSDEIANREEFTSALKQLVAKVENSEVTLDNEDFESLASAVVKAIKADGVIAPVPITPNQGSPVLVSEIADAVNQRLADLTKEDSFIYNVREELATAVDGIKLPANFGSLTEEEKYKVGIREGIRLAVEMGLILPDA